MDKTASFGNTINRKKAFILILIVILFTISFSQTFLGKYIILDVFIPFILLVAFVPILIGPAWTFKENYMEITKELNWYHAVINFFSYLFSRDMHKLAHIVKYDEIKNIELIYKIVKGQGPANPMGDNFYIKLRLNNQKVYDFDMRLVHDNERKINTVVNILRFHNIEIIDKRNILDLIKDNKNLYATFHKQ